MNAAPARPAGFGIFISYRRDDATGASGRLYDWLRIAFGRHWVFRDVATLGAGKWRETIDGALAMSAVCLPVIGRRWFDAENSRRLFEVDDMVRLELRAALSRQGVTVIPALVEGAGLPKRDLLPPDLRGLLDWHAYPLSEAGWEDDMRRLLVAVAAVTTLTIAPDTDALLGHARDAGDRIRALEEDRKLESDQIRALTTTIADLTRRLPEAPDRRRAEIGDALSALAEGNTALAEAEFERVLAESTAVAASACREAGEAARNIANLALLGDIRKAVTYYRRAADLDPAAAENWRLLGHASMTAGNTAAAEEALSRALKQAEASGDRWHTMAAQTSLGDLAMLRGALEEAQRRFQAAGNLAIGEVDRDPGDTEWQRALSVSCNKVGDVRVALGELPGALEAFEAGKEIARQLAERDPANTLWQRDLGVSWNRIGDVRVTLGELSAALEAFEAGEEIARRLTERDPANTLWQRDLSVSRNRIGDVRLVQDQLPAAFEAFEAGHEIVRRLTERDPANTLWQRDLSMSWNKIGDVRLAQGQLPAALEAFEEGKEIARRLTECDPANTLWQRDLSMSCNRIGDVRLAQGQLHAALAAFEAAIAVARRLTEREPANTGWQRDLSVSWNRIGDVRAAQGDGPGAVAAYRKGLTIAEALAARDSSNAVWSQDLIVSLVKLHELTAERGFALRALDVAREIERRGILAPRDARLIDDLKRRAGP